MSVQDKLGRVRPEIIHIQYEVRTGDAIQQKELPFLVGVMADLAGNSPAKKLEPLAKREFIDIDRDTFGQVMKKIAPELQLRVANKLEPSKADSELAINLTLNRMEDFTPEGIAEKVPVLTELMNIRKQLAGLLNKLDGKDDANELLETLIRDMEKSPPSAALPATSATPATENP